MFGAIYLAFGKQGVFTVMEDPRKFFDTYQAALKKNPKALKGCPRLPDGAAKMALAIGAEKSHPASGPDASGKKP
jgi:hypothetical protein